MATIEATLIPGGGVTAAGKVTPWSAARLDRAIATHCGEYLLPLSAGTPHKPPPLDDQGHPIGESAAAARYLIERGIAPHRVLPETCSLDTLGNAYFARVIHTDPRGFRQLKVITSDFHLPRTRAIFEWIFGLSAATPTYGLTFEAVPAVGLSSAAWQARWQKEQASLETVRRLSHQIHTLADLHRWLYTEHRAYAIAPASMPASQSMGGTTFESYLESY